MFKASEGIRVGRLTRILSRYKLPVKLLRQKLQHLSNTASKNDNRRYGFVSYYHPADGFGFVVEDGKEGSTFRFTAADIMTDGTPKTRCYEPVSFEVNQAHGRLMAMRLQTPDGQKLEYYHQNSNITPKRRLQRYVLEDMDRRHIGIITRFDPKNGWGSVTPDKRHMKNLAFNVDDLLTTGKRKIREDSRVEFDVLPCPEREMDMAKRISRPGGGLITYETQDIGRMKRMLGAMYREEDEYANVVDSGDRRRGFISEWNPDRGYGFASLLEKPEQRVLVTADTCHMYGTRQLRHYEEVDFDIAPYEDESKLRALHVTAPELKVLRYDWPSNMQLFSKDKQRPKTFESGSTVYFGEVAVVAWDSAWGLLQTRDPEINPIFFHPKDLVVTDTKAVRRRSIVEFKVRKEMVLKDDGETEELQLRAHAITAPGGRPLTYSVSYVGDFYRKLNQATSMALPEIPIGSKDERHEGLIVAFDSVKQMGHLELLYPPDGKRHAHLILLYEDLKLPKQRTQQAKFEQLTSVMGKLVGCHVTFSVSGFDPDGVNTWVNRKAVNICSFGMDIVDPNFKLELHL